MSILIRGMAMPKYCEACAIFGWCRQRNIYCMDENHENFIRPSDCPLIELPPHGRLIDADAMVKQMHDNIQKTNNVRYAWVDELDIALAPTIIEAEDSFFNSLKCGLEQAINGDVREITIIEAEGEE